MKCSRAIRIIKIENNQAVTTVSLQGFIISSLRELKQCVSMILNLFDFHKIFSKIKTKSYHGGNLQYYISSERSEVIDLSDDYEGMQLDEDPDNIPEHENKREVIISRDKNEIIFWAHGVF